MRRLSDFKGVFLLKRTIDDRLSGAAGRFEGKAVFETAPSGLLYREEGQLRLGEGPAFTAHRTYLWREAGGRIFVDYPDGRAFHDFDPGEAAARHWCDPDDYRVRYDFSGWPDWRAEWEVRGPRKDYRMLSLYRRGG